MDVTFELDHLCNSDGWQREVNDGAITKTFLFHDFAEAFAFMQAMAAFSEDMKHHPEWFNVYNRVEVRLTTHDVGGLSAFDVAWAKKANLTHQKRGVAGK